jgi:rhamnogalacturonyl hydrolase YesR
MMNMRTGMSTAIVGFVMMICGSVSSETDAEFMRRFADRLVAETRLALLDKTTKEEVEIGEARTDAGALAIASPLAAWGYPGNLYSHGLVRLGRRLEEPRYVQLARDIHAWHFELLEIAKERREQGRAIQGLGNLGRMSNVWNTGGSVTALADRFMERPNPEHLAYLQKCAEHLLEKVGRGATGVFVRGDGAISVDDVYAVSGFFARMSLIEQNEAYMELALDQVDLFWEPLWVPYWRLLAQQRDPELGYTSDIFWNRGCGWFALALVDLLRIVPEEHPRREALLERYRKLMYGLVRWQGSSGLWHHLVDRGDSPVETAGSAMIVYALATGINEGWLDRTFRDAAYAGWDGIRERIDDDLRVHGTAEGVHMNVSPAYHYQVEQVVDDPRAFGPVLLAGEAIIQLKSNSAPNKRAASWKSGH